MREAVGEDARSGKATDDRQLLRLNKLASSGVQPQPWGRAATGTHMFLCAISARSTQSLSNTRFCSSWKCVGGCEAHAGMAPQGGGGTSPQPGKQWVTCAPPASMAATGWAAAHLHSIHCLPRRCSRGEECKALGLPVAEVHLRGLHQCMARGRGGGDPAAGAQRAAAPALRHCAAARGVH